MKRNIFKDPADFSRLVLVLGITAFVAVISLLTGCSTTIPVTYTEPARLNMSGVKRVAISSSDSRIIAPLSQKIAESGKYTVAPESELFDWIQWKEGRRVLAELADYQKQAAEISAAELVGEYARNTARADSSYMGKTLKITAVVKEIGSSGGRYFVRLEGADNDSVDVFFISSEESRIAAVDKGQTITVIGKCNGFKRPDLEDTAEILRLLGAGRSINIIEAAFPVEGLEDYPGAVDAVIFLSYTITSVADDSRVESRAVGKDADGNTIYRDVKVYIRTVTVNLDYQIESTRNGSIIAQGTKSAKGSDSSESGPPDATGIAARAIFNPLNEFASEILPTQRSTSLTLAKEKENKEAKKEMSEAEKLVKAKNYADATAAYGKIYDKYKNFAAGYNQAVLTEVAAGTEEAIVLMEVLIQKEPGNTLAQSTLKGMQDRNAANQATAEQLSQ
jgi:hypothetical protein